MAIIIVSIFIYRSFCRYICPLGAFYSLLNKVSFYKCEVDKNKCTNCGACVHKCKIICQISMGNRLKPILIKP
ncbi:4Fe-4S binding protein [Clostridium sp. WILCCON 0269]|uniref:4Fe-4S binding protein n=1 Tax=Candidatus Clostridium eludens TaxID=3381663 RepID=A0ABW8SRZ5_9CLOT